MKLCGGRTLLSGVVVAFIAAIPVAPSAFAKGPSQGVITGPGLARPISLTWSDGPTAGPDLSTVVDQSGFFIGMWGGTRGRLAHRPAGTLGPCYTITYTMTLGSGHSDQVVQYVFPYAEPRPITYMPAHQKYWKTYETEGAWFVPPHEFGGTLFRQTLIRLGLPENAPSGIQSPATGTDVGTGSVAGKNGSLAIPLSIAAAVVGVTLAAILTRRRRTRQSLHA